MRKAAPRRIVVPMSKRSWGGCLGAALLGVALFVAPPLTGQATARPDPPAVEPGSHLTVYLMTMGEGDLVWERFGHNAIWIHDSVAGTDRTYNWGLFDFDQPGFLRRFIQGRMLYVMDAFDAAATAQAYMQSNRSVWVQQLNLAPAQRLALLEFVEWNRRPENRAYRYDYYYDNCSTRVRDALDAALGGAIADQTAHVPADMTFRDHTRRLTTNDPVTYTGLMAGLGPEVDREVSRWDEMFLPLAMREHVRHLTVADADGRDAPLVISEQEWFLADRPPLRATPPRWWPAYLALGVVLAVLLLALGHFAGRSPIARAGLAGLVVVWAGVVGLLGLILAGLWGLTDHTAAYRNENLFQFNPLALGLVVLFPVLLYRPGRTDRWTAGLAAVVAGLAVLGLLVKPQPWFIQVNGELIALALPVHLAVAIVAWLLIRTRLPVAGRVASAADPADRSGV